MIGFHLVAQPRAEYSRTAIGSAAPPAPASHRRARRLHLFGEGYIFDLPTVIAVETPQLGHATYLFSKPQSIEAVLAAYPATTKEAIRQNRANVAERLGFLARVVHGSNPRIWLQALTAHLGEAADYAPVASERE
ncbi:MAG: hypothetical protein WBO19_15440 [Terriglobia bacterium]